MLDEKRMRHVRFLPGAAVRLADGQVWTLPTAGRGAGPSVIDPEGGPVEEADFGPEYEMMVRAVIDSEDRYERQRAELALAILLLTRNYRLESRDLQAILSFPEGHPGVSKAQTVFHDVALTHVRSSFPVANENAPRPHAVPSSIRPKLDVQALSRVRHAD